MPGKPVLDFDVVREPWNKYELTDGAFIKVKVVVTKIRKEQVDEKTVNYGSDSQNIVVVLTEETGTPDSKVYSPEEIQESLIKRDIRYTTVSEEWNEYVADDGARLRIKITLTSVSKTNKFDKNGAPIYFVETGMMGQVRKPTP